MHEPRMGQDVASSLKRMLLEASLSSLPALSSSLPWRMLRPLFHEATRGSQIALCLHRVSERRREGELLPELTILTPTLDEFLDEVGNERGLLLSFDDGYRDSGAYIANRASRFLGVRWLAFVCPEKIERRAGFRWDHVERLGTRTGHRVIGEILDTDLDRRRENAREALLEVGRAGEFELLSVGECLSLAALPRVALGNHTNVHFRLSRLSDADAREEIRTSTSDFERLFGPSPDFAFPFGFPKADFGPQHVEMLQRVGARALWTTQHRTYRCEESLRPRFGIDGRWSAKQIALWISAICLRHRAR